EGMKNPEGRNAMLEALLRTELFISPLHLVLSDKTTSVHIINKQNPVHDAVIVCRKRRLTPRRVTWDEIEAAVLKMVEDGSTKLYRGGASRQLADEDIFIFLIGKCLQLYSANYPEVYNGQDKVDLEDVLRGLKCIKSRFLARSRSQKEELRSC
nr:hypothetical protein [Candidatus Sigynarchaeota archaeon]